MGSYRKLNIHQICNRLCPLTNKKCMRKPVAIINHPTSLPTNSASATNCNKTNTTTSNNITDTVINSSIAIRASFIATNRNSDYNLNLPISTNIQNTSHKRARKRGCRAGVNRKIKRMNTSTNNNNSTTTSSLVHSNKISMLNDNNLNNEIMSDDVETNLLESTQSIMTTTIANPSTSSLVYTNQQQLDKNLTFSNQKRKYAIDFETDTINNMSSKNQKLTSSNTQQPTTSINTQQPTTSSNTQQPTTSINKQQPTTSSNTQQPTTSINTQQPTTTSNTQHPTTSINTQQPTTTSNTQQPTTSSNTQQPTTSINKQPTTSSNTQQPTTSINKKPNKVMLVGQRLLTDAVDGLRVAVDTIKASAEYQSQPSDTTIDILNDNTNDTNDNNNDDDIANIATFNTIPTTTKPTIDITTTTLSNEILNNYTNNNVNSTSNNNKISSCMSCSTNDSNVFIYELNSSNSDNNNDNHQEVIQELTVSI